MLTKLQKPVVRTLVYCCVMVLTSFSAHSQTADPLLFESNDLLELVMPVDFDTLCRPSQMPDCDYTPSEFRFTDSAGNEHFIPISIRRRDGWRALETNCQMPTLFVRFSLEDVVGTPFEGQTFLALTSHCGKGISPENVPSRRMPDKFETYVINEYLGYRLNNLVTEISLRVRPVRIRYTHPEKPRQDFTHYAFFAEHFESLASRYEAELLPPQSFDPEKLDHEAADQLALFQYMVGNTDWSISNQDNVILLRFPDGRHVPVLFDLDQTGLVNAFYARPAPHLPISSVKQRYYLGYCRPDIDWDALFSKFSDQRDVMLTLVAEVVGLGRGDRRAARVYLESFFNIIDSERAQRNGVVNACQPMPS